MSPALAGGFFTTEPPGKAKDVVGVVLVVDHFLKSVLNLLQYCLFYVFGFLAMRRGVLGRFLAPQPGIKPAPPNWKAKCLNHWRAREVPDNGFLIN